MKQKNLVLLGASVGIALVAAYLLATLTNKPPEDVELATAYVIKGKSLNLGTQLTDPVIAECVEQKEFPKADLEAIPDLIRDVKELKDKRLTRTLRVGERFTKADVASFASVPLPDGHNMYTIRMDSIRAVAGFVLPGRRVDMMLTESKDGKRKTSMIFRDMLVVAVDIMDKQPETGAAAVPTLNSVSVAVLPKQGMELALAEGRGTLAMQLRQLGDPNREMIPPVKLLPGEEDDTQAAPNAPTQKTVRVYVAKKDIEANTKVTKDTFSVLFAESEVLETGKPGSAILNRDDAYGLYLPKGLDKDQTLLKGALSTDPAQLVKAPDAPAPVVEAVKPKKKDETSGLTIIQGQSIQELMWRKTADGTWKLMAGPAEGAPEADGPGNKRTN